MTPMTEPHCRIGKIRLKTPHSIARRLPKKSRRVALQLMRELGRIA